MIERRAAKKRFGGGSTRRRDLEWVMGCNGMHCFVVGYVDLYISLFRSPLQAVLIDLHAARPFGNIIAFALALVARWTVMQVG